MVAFGKIVGNIRWQLFIKKITLKKLLMTIDYELNIKKSFLKLFHPSPRSNPEYYSLSSILIQTLRERYALALKAP